MSVQRETSLELKVGVFVLMGLALFAITLLVLGGEQNLFERNYTLMARFSDISGLRVGAAVRLAGMDVGVVDTIEFPTDVAKKEIHVRLRIANSFRPRIRGDSLATIVSQGLLGDKFVSLTLGAPDQNPLEHGSWLESQDPTDLFGGLDEIKSQIMTALRQINVLLSSDGGETAGKSITGILGSLRAILQEVEDGRGVIHALVYDAAAGDDARRMIASIAAAADGLQQVITDIRTGDGGLHDVIYEDHLSELVQKLDRTATDLEAVMAQVRSGDGLVHDLVYGDEQTKALVANLAQTSADLRDIVASIKAGEGTLGALVADPTVYGDVKAVLGGAKRNEVIKAFVRSSIRSSERAEGIGDAGTTRP